MSFILFIVLPFNDMDSINDNGIKVINDIKTIYIILSVSMNHAITPIIAIIDDIYPVTRNQSNINFTILLIVWLNTNYEVISLALSSKCVCFLLTAY